MEPHPALALVVQAPLPAPPNDLFASSLVGVASRTGQGLGGAPQPPIPPSRLVHRPIVDGYGTPSARSAWGSFLSLRDQRTSRWTATARFSPLRRTEHAF